MCMGSAKPLSSNSVWMASMLGNVAGYRGIRTIPSYPKTRVPREAGCCSWPGFVTVKDTEYSTLAVRLT